MRRYPRTRNSLGLFVIVGIVLVIVLLWPLSSWLFLGGLVAFVLYKDVRRDRRAHVCRCGALMVTRHYCERGHRRGDL